MKKLLVSLLFVVIAMMTSQTSALNRLYIDDIVLNPDQLGSRITIPVKASFDSYVSAWDIGFVFPEGMTPVKLGYYAYVSGPDLEVSYYYFSDWENEWEERTVTAYPQDYINGQTARFITFLTASGYEYNPNYNPDEDDYPEPYGGVKWEPGDYQMFYLTVDVDEYFTNGPIEVVSTTTCGWDSRFGNVHLIEDSTAQPIPVAYEYEDSTYYYYVYPGEVNGDGTINIDDITAMISFIFGEYDSWTTLEICDMDANGVVDLIDVMILTDHLLTGYELYNGYRMVGYELQTVESAVIARVLIKGDMSGDGVLSIADVTMLIDALLQGQSPDAGDVNGDGRISIADVTALIDKLLSNSSM